MLSIIRDSVILFLLIYAVIDLTSHLVLLIMRSFGTRRSTMSFFSVADASRLTADMAEYALRTALLSRDEPLVVLTDGLPDDVLNILLVLSRRHEQLHPCSKAELVTYLTAKTVQDAALKNEETAVQNHNR